MSGGAPEKFRFEPLDVDKHDRAGFSSGSGTADVYLQRHAPRDMARRIAVVMVLTRDGKTIDGYYTLRQFLVDCSRVGDDRRASFDAVEAPDSVLLRLATSRRVERESASRLLLMGALKNVLDYDFRLGQNRFVSVVVEARDGRAYNFYRQFGFVEVPDYQDYMFLTMGVVREIFAAAAKPPEPVKDDRKKSERKKKNEWDHGYNPPDAEPLDHYASGLARFWRKRAG